ncbi:hypothetical protein I4U23_022232 [Adineta vaga]|nr:hypothetical protein I4U23_022232 [Adineta vaga]
MYLAESAQGNSTLVGIVFEMDIDGIVSTTPFAELEDKDSRFTTEKEVLFSMHTIFRIDEITEITDGLWYVQLKLTNDQDKELLCLNEKIRREIRGNSPRYRLSHLLGKMGKFNDATDVLLELLNTISENDWIFRAAIDHQLGVMHRERGEYDVALLFYNAALKYLHPLKIQEENLLSDHLYKAYTYASMAKVFYGLFDDENVFENLKFAFEIALRDKTPAHKEALETFREIATYMIENRDSFTR